MPRRGDRVGRLARLGDGDDERLAVERRRAVAELRADRGPRRQARPVLDRGGADERRVVRAAAGDQLHPLHAPNRVGQGLELLDLDPAVAVDPPGDRLAQCLRLLVDLLEHEVVVAALLGGLGRPRDQRLRALAPGAVDVGHLDAARQDVGDVALLEEHDPVRVGEDRRDVAGDEALFAVPPDDQRHVLACPDEPADLALVHHDDRVRALELAEGGPDRVGQVALVLVRLFDEMGDRLGVGLRRQRVAARLESVAQLAEVLDDPVVDDRDVAGAVLVGVGVQVVRPAVGRPAGVSEADRGVRRPVGDRGRQVRQLAGLLLDEQVAVLVDEGDPGRVIPAVLEPLQPFDENRARLAGTRVADDAAHVSESVLRRSRTADAARSERSLTTSRRSLTARPPDPDPRRSRASV